MKKSAVDSLREVEVVAEADLSSCVFRGRDAECGVREHDLPGRHDGRVDTRAGNGFSAVCRVDDRPLRGTVHERNRVTVFKVGLVERWKLADRDTEIRGSSQPDETFWGYSIP